MKYEAHLIIQKQPLQINPNRIWSNHPSFLETIWESDGLNNLGGHCSQCALILTFAAHMESLIIQTDDHYLPHGSRCRPKQELNQVYSQ